MANYCEQSRSNYVKVKSKKAFQKFLERFGDTVELIEKDDDPGRVGFLARDGLPSSYIPYDSDAEPKEVDFVTEAARYLADNEVLIVMSNGYENLRYLTGYAVAINNKQEHVSINLDHIHTQARQLTSQPRQITRAEY